MRRRLCGVAALAALGLVLASPSAGAHALLDSSDPTDGEQVARAPEAVTLVFTESPERSLSSIHVLDTSGTSHEQGAPQPVKGRPRALTVGVKTLPRGTYTVTWRVVSSVDGHATAGAFAFGVGVAPTAPPGSSVVETPPPSLLEMVGRWALFVGLIGLVGGAWVGAGVFGATQAGVRRQAGLAWFVSVVGLVIFAEAQRRSAGSSIGALLGTPLGRSLIWRAVGIGVAGAALRVERAAVQRARVAALWVAGAGAAGSMFAHVAAGHAAASDTLPLAQIVGQWAHFAAVGVWIGGLAAVLIGVRGPEAPDKARAARRFSTVAGVALAVVAATGVVRALNEVGTWGQLWSTGYGRVVVIKVSLILVLAALGARNRLRNIPRVDASLTPLRRTSALEVGVAVVTLGAAAVLASLAPPTNAGARAEAASVVVSGSDFATSVRIRLEVTPGTAGPNRFEARITDYDTGEPVEADRASLRFRFLDDPGVGGSTLDLARAPDGTYAAQGSNLSLDGRWRVTVLIERGADSMEVPLELATRTTPQPVRCDRFVGQPTLCTVTLAGGGSVQIYADPERPGRSEVHVTYFDAGGNERKIRSLILSVTPPSGSTSGAKLLRFSAGHFVAGLTLEPGTTHFVALATARDGARLRAEVDLQIRGA